MAGARHLDHRAPRQLTHEARRRLAREDGALGAAHEERRATDLPHLLPQALEVRLQPAAADAGIELVAPAAVGALAERVAAAGADVLRRAAPRRSSTGGSPRAPQSRKWKRKPLSVVVPSAGEAIMAQA